MAPAKIVHYDSEIDVKDVDDGVSNKWRWDWLNHSFKLDLGVVTVSSIQINYALRFFTISDISDFLPYHETFSMCEAQWPCSVNLSGEKLQKAVKAKRIFMYPGLYNPSIPRYDVDFLYRKGLSFHY